MWGVSWWVFSFCFLFFLLDLVYPFKFFQAVSSQALFIHPARRWSWSATLGRLYILLHLGFAL